MSAKAKGGKFTNWDTIRFNFKYFLSIDDFLEKGLNSIDRNKERQPTDVDKLEYDTKIKRNSIGKWQRQKDYSRLDTLNRLIDEMEVDFAQIDMGGTFKKSRLKITSDERGVFSFGLASQGLYRPQEYFSKELAIDSPKEFNEKPSGVVPEEYIEFVKIHDKMQYWYSSSNTNKKYQCIAQQEGTREVDLGLRKYPKFRTKTKKSYVMFEKKGGKAKMVELFIPLHLSVELGNVFPLYMVVKYLRQMNIMVRINSLRMVHQPNNEFFAWCVPIKDYGEELDYNQIAKTSQDRSWWEVMKTNLRAITDDEKYYGVLTQKGEGLEAGYRNDYNNAFSRFKNWYLEEIKKGELPPLRVDKRLLLFGGAFSNTSHDGIMEEVYRILDLIDFQFNDLNACLKRIYKREVDGKLEKFYEIRSQNNWGSGQGVDVPQDDIDKWMENEKKNLVSSFKTYVTQIFVDTYTYPTAGEYATPQEEADKIEDEFDDKIAKLNTYLRNL